MSKPVPDHGTSARYKGRKNLPGCRCQKCTDAATRADAKCKLDRLAGRPHQIPAGPAITHVRALMDRGLSVSQIAREAGWDKSSINRLLLRQKDILAVNAAKILAVPLDVRVSLGDVPAVGATRRIRALYALGHLNRVIAEETGLSKDAVSAIATGAWATVKVSSDDAIRSAYDRLSMQTGTSWKTRTLAERNEWAPPLAWDDDTIDDPAAVPQTDAPVPVASEGGNLADRWIHGESVVLTPEARKEVLAHLYEWTNQTTAEIAEQLGMTPEAAEQQWNRTKRAARLEGRRMWRRVYVPRERTLNQNEMEEAA